MPLYSFTGHIFPIYTSNGRLKHNVNSDLDWFGSVHWDPQQSLELRTPVPPQQYGCSGDKFYGAVIKFINCCSIQLY